MFRASNFDKLLDKATSNLRLDPDWPTILQICDLIRQNDCSPKYAVAAVKKKLYSQNPHQAMFSLLTLESIVKNCGSGVHDEVTSKVFCEMLRDLVKTTPHENLRTKILELIQAWAFAFRNAPKYRAVQDTVNILKAEGFKFPTLKESDAMFSADTAPEWADGEVCHRCRTTFSLIVRRHHCRACGQVFCQQCSSKTSTLPKFGIEKEVRVCDACYDKVSRPPSSSAKIEIVDTANDYGPTQPQKRPTGGKTAEELQEEEELQLALALSQSEAEHKEKERKSRSHIAPSPTPHHPTVSPTASSVSASPEHSGAGAGAGAGGGGGGAGAGVTNTELSRYLDRNYWEQRSSRDAPSAAPTAPAPASHTSHDAVETFAKPSTTAAQDDDAEDKEIDDFVESLKSQVEIFVNRMKSNSSRGRSIANDTAVQTLFMNITAMHSRLLRFIQQQDDKRVYLESLQDKVTQIRDSRAALDTLRAEHSARVAAAAEAAERQRQVQMATKLHAMRKKKHEYLQYQRQLALHKVQEQEREMQMRQEQQKHQYMMSANSYYMPGVSMQQYQPPYQSQPMYANPQFHPQMMPQVTTDGTMNMPGQPQISQANMPMGTISQSMPQIANTFAMSTAGAAPVTQSQQPMNQQNIRPNIGQQMPMQQQMLMQQMHQMRMAGQPGVHQMIPQNMPNGMPQNIPQQNGQAMQLQKQSLPNQPQPPMMPPMSVGQQNMGQSMMNPSNPILGMQMQNMRMPQMQGNQPSSNQQVPVSGYPINIQNPNQPPASQPNMQQSQIPGQQMSMPGQHMMQGPSLPGQTQGLPMHNQLPSTNANMTSHGPQVPQTQGQAMSQPPQMAQGQPMSLPGQPMQPPGPQMMIQGQQMTNQGQIPQQSQQMLKQVQNLPQQGQQMLNQGQNLPQQGQQILNQGQNLPQQGQPMLNQSQQMPVNQLPPGQGQQMMHGQQMQQLPQMQGQIPQQMGGPVQQMQQGQPMQQGGQPMQQGGQPMQQGGQPMQQNPSMQGQNTSQGQPAQNIPGQPMKMPPQNFGNIPPGQPQPPPNQTQQAQTPVKSEHNNNTAELISFD